ncbi:hypothetical protein ONZ45_g9665 [Pleurotus djamor]|nr:hypothetical protein ONZ45_g9665 [Pleurotus djamor]
MAVVGVDFGTLHSKIGVARHRGIDIITNEVSNRATPSLVAFGPKQRAIGESAKTQETSNFKNTIGSLKRLIGRSLNDPDVELEKKFLNAKLIDLNGQVGTQVNYVSIIPTALHYSSSSNFSAHNGGAVSSTLRSNSMSSLALEKQIERTSPETLTDEQH